MKSEAAKSDIRVLRSDITGLAVDAIVNAANEQMLGGGGVDGAIHRAAGAKLLAACRAVPELRPGIRCPTGECRITPGFDLPARHVLHTVGPVWRGGQAGEPSLLAACYRNCLNTALAHELHTVAFPAISCGVFAYPVQDAAQLSVEVIRAWHQQHPGRLRVDLVAFSAEVAEAWSDCLASP